MNPFRRAEMRDWVLTHYDEHPTREPAQIIAVMEQTFDSDPDFWFARSYEELYAVAFPEGHS